MAIRLKHTALAALALLAACESAGSSGEPAADVSVESSTDLAAPVEPYAPVPSAAAEERSADATLAEAMPPEAPLAAPPARPRPAPQSGTLTAGDHDDLLNPGLYADFVHRFRLTYDGPGAPEIDTARRITVNVTGENGRPMLGARVRLTRADGAVLERTTAANGALVLFPALDGLPERVEMTVAAPDGGASVRRAFAVTPARRNTTVAVALPAAAAPAKALDLLLAVDTTGSMDDELDFLKAELSDIVATVAADNPGLQTRIGLIVYRDVGDSYVVRSFPFTRDVAALQRALAAQSAGGGGDFPEAVDQALDAALQFDWNPRAVKTLVFVADAPPHAELAEAAWRNAMSVRAQGVHIVPVAASGVDPEAEHLMRAMAAATQSRYLFLTDDSGVGLPHGEPAVDCYLVTRLDGLLRRVLTGLVAGRRIEPSAAEVVREVGDYDAGVCRTPA